MRSDSFRFDPCAACFAIALAAASGCRGEREEVREARVVTSAYEAFEKAAPADRPAALEALRAAPGRTAAARTARDACAAYASALLAATTLARQAHALGPEDAGGNGAATAEEHARMVVGADEALGEAEKAQASCKTAMKPLYDAMLSR
jgi:hypothetical protein